MSRLIFSPIALSTAARPGSRVHTIVPALSPTVPGALTQPSRRSHPILLALAVPAVPQPTPSTRVASLLGVSVQSMEKRRSERVSARIRFGRPRMKCEGVRITRVGRRIRFVSGRITLVTCRIASARVRIKPRGFRIAHVSGRSEVWNGRHQVVGQRVVRVWTQRKSHILARLHEARPHPQHVSTGAPEKREPARATKPPTIAVHQADAGAIMSGGRW